jgi:hypothetical protein
MSITKFLITVLLLALAGAAVACGDDDGGNDQVGQNEASPTETAEDSGDGDGEASPGGETDSPGGAPDSPPEVDGEPTTAASGLQYIIIEPGGGDPPTAEDSVLVDYTGWIAPDGPKFDSSLDRGQATLFQVNGVIPGFAEGLQLIQPGGTTRLIIPPELAYGENGAGELIPPNATLIFDVTLIGIQ